LPRRHESELVAELALLAICGKASGLARGTASTLAKKSDTDAARKNPAGTPKIFTKALLPHEFSLARQAFSHVTE
jgi:hypothetical protein